MKKKLLGAAIVAGTLAIVVSLVAGGHAAGAAAVAAVSLRWVAIALIAGYAGARRSLTAWIVVGLLAGAELGHDWPAAAENVQFLGTIFLRLIKVIIAPLLFGTLVVGIAGHADLKKVGRLGIKSLVYFEIVSVITLVIGFAAIDISRAGEGVHLPPVVGAAPLNVAPHTAAQIITDIFPENIAKSVAEGQVLQVVVFSVLFAMALALVPGAKRRPMLAFAESLSETMFKFTNLVMYAAPIGVFGAIAYTVGHLGLGVLLPLVKLLATMYVALLFFFWCALADCANGENTVERFCAGGDGAGDDCVCYGEFGSGVADRDGRDGSVWSAARNGGVCSADGVQLQFGRVEFVSVAGAGVYRAGGGDASDDWATGRDDADFADQQ